MSYGLLMDHDAAVVAWANKEFNLFPMQFFRAFGILDPKEPKLVGAAIFSNYNGMNVELSYYGPRTLSPGIIKSLAKIGLSLGIARATLITSKRNRRLIRSLLKLGFKLEGTQRCFYGRTDNTRNTGVRLVIFREGLDKLAGTPESKPETEQEGHGLQT